MIKAKFPKAIFGICWLFLLVFWAVSYADYHYADYEGSNEYPYTSWETAAHLIQDAVDASSPHDTVYIGAGEYYQTIRIPTETDHLSIIGMGIDSTYIWRDILGEYLLWSPGGGADDIFVKSIHFDAIGACISTGLLTDLLTVRECKFTSSDGMGCAIMTSIYGSSLEVENCIFEDVGSGVSTPWAAAPLVSVRNCLFISVYGYAIYPFGNKVVVENNIGERTGILFFARNGLIDTLIFNNNLTYYNDFAFSYGDVDSWGQINNNTSYKDTQNNPGNDDERAYRYTSVDTLLSYNNTITGDEIGIEFIHDMPNAYIDLRYNNLRNGYQDIRFVGDYGTLDTSVIYHEFPMFVSEDDFHLQTFSPLIDAGHPDILDVDGTRSDIGCYGGPGGCSYTYLDLAPQIPDSINATIDSNIIVLNWQYNSEADFNRYQIFKDTIQGFQPTIFHIIAEPETSYYEDDDIIEGVPYYYRLTSVDNQGNISDYSDEVAVIPTSIPGFINDGLIKYTVINSIYPNPANSYVTIVYSASNLGPQPPLITLKIFDVQGRVVKTLIDERKQAGTYRIVWDGTNDFGENVASGIYIAKVFQWYQDAGDFPVKITLVK